LFFIVFTNITYFGLSCALKCNKFIFVESISTLLQKPDLNGTDAKTKRWWWNPYNKRYKTFI